MEKRISKASYGIYIGIYSPARMNIVENDVV